MVTMQAIVDTMNTFDEETILVVGEAVNVDVREKPMCKVINQEVAQEEKWVRHVVMHPPVQALREYLYQKIRKDQHK